MMNNKQRMSMFAGLIAAYLVILFPPYFDSGSLLSTVQFAFIFRPPAWNYASHFWPVFASRVWLLQLSVIICFTFAFFLAGSDRANRRAKAALSSSAFLSILFTGFNLCFSLFSHGRGWLSPPFLLCLIPIQFPGGYILFWLRLAILALITLLAVYLANLRRWTAKTHGASLAISGTAFLLVCFVTYAELMPAPS